MHHFFRRARLVSVPIHFLPTRRSVHLSFPFFRITPEILSQPLCRTFSRRIDASDELFNYTSGRWLVNESLRLAERRREFNVDELCRLAAHSVDRSPQDIVKFAKLAEGGFNRTFLITMRDGFQMVARIPYPMTVPKYYCVASEAATIRFLRAADLPVPEVYDYSLSPDNAAETEYMFMEYIKGLSLGDMWMDLDERQIDSVVCQLVQLESRIMDITFPAGGSLYYGTDLEKLGGGTGVHLEDERLSIGPGTEWHMWHGRRSQLDVDRGPYRSVEETLMAPAHKEQAFLKLFGRPMQPFRRERREYYEFKEQSHFDHLKNLESYLLVVPSLVPQDPALHRFHIRHPDLRPSNVIVLPSPDSEQLEVVSLIDWQHASILPQFLHADVPEQLQIGDDYFSQHIIKPWLPGNLSELGPDEQLRERELYHDRLVHYHYARYTEKYNKPHHDALWDPLCILVRRLFVEAGNPWEGDSHALKVWLIDAMERWEALLGKGVQCPIAFGPEELREAQELTRNLKIADESYKFVENALGFGSGTWLPNDRYERSKENSAIIKEKCLELLEAENPELAKNHEVNWFLGDMDETEYK